MSRPVKYMNGIERWKEDLKEIVAGLPDPLPEPDVDAEPAHFQLGGTDANQ